MNTLYPPFCADNSTWFHPRVRYLAHSPVVSCPNPSLQWRGSGGFAQRTRSSFRLIFVRNIQTTNGIVENSIQLVSCCKVVQQYPVYIFLNRIRSPASSKMIYSTPSKVSYLLLCNSLQWFPKHTFTSDLSLWPISLYTTLCLLTMENP